MKLTGETLPRHRAARCLTVLVLLAVLLGALLPHTAQATETGTADFSRPGSTLRVTEQTAAWLASLLGEPLSAAEESYLSTHATLTLSYDNRIPTSFVTLLYREGTLTVTVAPYRYTAVNGETVCWVPQAITLTDGRTQTPVHTEADIYEATFEQVEEDRGLYATVRYRTELTLSAQTVNGVLNLAHEAAVAAREAEEGADAAYEAAMSAYRESEAAYAAYLSALAAYEAALPAYQNYLLKQQEYKAACAAYQNYLSELAYYESECERYRAYEEALLRYQQQNEAYQRYLEERQSYEERLARYEAYLTAQATVADQLAILALCQVPMTDGRTLYDAVMGNAVTEVLDNKSLLTGPAVGASEEVIDLAADATERLRAHMTAYFSLTDEREQYLYYAVNYESLRDGFTDLLCSLDVLYGNRKVKAEIETRGKTRKFQILLAQLVLVVNAITDAPVYNYVNQRQTVCFDGSWRVDGLSADEVLEHKTYYVDRNAATPLAAGYPVAVTQPTAPQEQQEPQPPQAVTRPVQPTPVTEPVAPTPVPAPQLPQSVADPGEAPVRRQLSEEERMLYDALLAGDLQARAPLTGDAVLVREASVMKKVFSPEEANVFFYDAPEGTLLYRVTVDSGTCADYIGELPTRAEDVGYTYAFDGWCDAEGTLIDLSSVTCDTVLYPHFRPVAKRYPITFLSEGESVTVSVPYGTVPASPLQPHKAQDARYTYTFVGWDRELATVTGAATYQAVFSSTYRLPYAGGGAALTDDGVTLTVDARSALSASVDLLPICATYAGGRALRLQLPGGELSLTATSFASYVAGGYTVFSLQVRKRGTDGYRYAVSVQSPDGRVAPAADIAVTLPCDMSQGDGLRLYTGEGQTRRFLSYTLSDGTLRVTLPTGAECTLSRFYAIAIGTGALLPGLTADCEMAEAGERVTVSCPVPDGIALDGITVRTAAGELLTLDAEGGFLMPASGVTVTAAAHRLTYTVLFLSEGRVLSTQTLYWGELPQPPADPQRGSDATYAYTFAGWGREVAPVTGDAQYTAVWRRMRLPEREEPLISLSPSVWRLVRIALSLGLTLLLILLPSAILAVRLLLRRRRERLPVSPQTLPRPDSAGEDGRNGAHRQDR